MKKLFGCLVVFVMGLNSFALTVSTIFQNEMVLQRDMDVPIWGTVDPGSNVVVTLDGNTVASVTADGSGKWMARIGAYPHDGGQAHVLVVSSPGQPSITLSNVVFGDVYLAAGQSNMDRTLSIVWSDDAETAAANYPLIREVTIDNSTNSLVPYEDAVIKKDWRGCSPSTVRAMSATAYFFARELHRTTGVPIGLLRASRGARAIMHFLAPEGVAAIPELAALRQQLDEGPAPTNSAGSYYDLYNPMIAPLAPYGISGFIWYQCEWDTQDAENQRMYHQKMRALITGWRKVWGLGDLPFYYVQLPTWGGTDQAFHTRQSQLWTLSETNVGMVVSVDIGAMTFFSTNGVRVGVEVEPGRADDPLHPANKQDVGARMARWALRDTYGQNLVCSGPLFKSAVVEGSQIRVSFDYADGLFAGTKYATNAVVPVAGSPDNFEIAGANGVYVAATAVIDGSTVVVSSPSVPLPVHVRYCYADWPDEYNKKLYNSNSLPASPFQTAVKYGLVVINGSGDGWYAHGAGANLVADAAPSGKVFDRWIGLPSGIANPTAASTTVTMPAHQTYLMATYRDTDTSSYTLTVNQGSGTGASKAGSYRAIQAATPQAGYHFDRWIGATQTVENVSESYTTITMPASNVSLTATYVLVETNIVTYALTVNQGSGDGRYAADSSVVITADAAPADHVFGSWVINSGVATIANTNAYTTTLNMSTNAVVVTATYKTNSSNPAGAMIQHLDATISNSVTGSPVTQWADQSGNENHAVPAVGSVVYPSSSLSSSGLAGLDFGPTANSLELFTSNESKTWLDFTGAASTNSGFAVLIAFKCDSVLTNWNDLFGNTSGVGSGFGLRYSSSGSIVAYLGGVSAERPTSPIQAGNTVVYAFNYDAGAGSYAFWDSKNGFEVTRSVVASNFSKTTAVTLGRMENAPRYFKGMVGEVKVFRAKLSTAQFQSERDALVAKWITVPQASGYETWASTNSVGDAMEDYDSDGRNNLLEYAIGGNPKAGGDTTDPVIVQTGSTFGYSYQQRNDDPRLIYFLQGCTNLISPVWSNVNTIVITNSTSGEYDNVTRPIPLDENSLYIRLQINQQ